MFKLLVLLFIIKLYVRSNVFKLICSFHNKVCSLASFGTAKYDYEINTRKIFRFVTLINISVTAGGGFLLLIISAIVSSSSISSFCLYFGLFSSTVL